MAEMDYRYAADCIREHNRIHSRSEAQAIFITKALDLAADVLERSRWIPCSERLPEVFEDVLVVYLGFMGEKHITEAYMGCEENAFD